MKPTDRENDLFAITHGAFRPSDRPIIFEKARAKESSGAEWSAIVADFHGSKYWGFELLPFGHPETVAQETEEQKRAKEVRSFLWTAIQSLVVIKGVILFFGLNYAMEREEFYGGRDKNFYGCGLAFTIAISFGGLLVFAIRKSRSGNWN